MRLVKESSTFRRYERIPWATWFLCAASVLFGTGPSVLGHSENVYYNAIFFCLFIAVAVLSYEGIESIEIDREKGMITTRTTAFFSSENTMRTYSIHELTRISVEKEAKRLAWRVLLHFESGVVAPLTQAYFYDNRIYRKNPLSQEKLAAEIRKFVNVPGSDNSDNSDNDSDLDDQYDSRTKEQSQGSHMAKSDSKKRL